MDRRAYWEASESVPWEGEGAQRDQKAQDRVSEAHVHHLENNGDLSGGPRVALCSLYPSSCSVAVTESSTTRGLSTGFLLSFQAQRLVRLRAFSHSSSTSGML